MENFDGYYHDHSSQFVGRREEMRLFDRLVEESNREGFRGLLVSGPPGIGKSRLLYEFTLGARKKRYPVSVHHFREGRQLSSDITWRRLIEDLKDIRIDSTPAHTVFEDFLFSTKSLAETAPVCIFLDNIHLAPELFHDELLEAIDELFENRVVLTLAYQDLPIYRRGSFVRFLSDLRKIINVVEHPLESLSVKDSVYMVEKLIGTRMSEDLKQKIVERSRGNPLFIQEISRTLRFQQKEADYEEKSFWTTDVPQIISTSISRRLQLLSPNCLDFIRKISLAGSHFSREEIEAILDTEGLETLDRCLDEALAQGFLVLEKDIRHFRFAHSLIHEAIRYTLPSSERRRMCREMAIKTEAAGLAQEVEWAERLGEWWREGGEGAEELNKARRYTLAAAENAFSHRNFSLALEMLENVVSTEKSEPESIEEADIFYTIAQIMSFGADPSGAMNYFEKALFYYLKEKRADKALRMSMHPIHLPVGESDIMDMFPGILADKDCTGVFRGMILLHYGGTLINYRGNFKKAEQVLNEALEMSRMTGDAHLKLQCYITSSYLDYFLGNFYESLQKLKTAGKMLEETGDVYSAPHVALGKCAVLTALGKSREASELMEPMLRSLSTLQNSYNLYMPYVTAARGKMLNGLWEDAVDYVERGLCQYPYNGMLLGYRTTIEYMQGNIERGDSFARYLSALNRGVGSGPYMVHVHASAVQTVRALCTGETAELRKTVVQLRGVTMHPNNHPFILVRVHILLCIIASLLNDSDLASVHYKKLQLFDRYHLVRPYFKYRALSRAAHCMGNHREAELYMGKALESVLYYHDLPMEAVLLYESAAIRLAPQFEDALYSKLRDTLCKALFQATEMGMEPLKKQVEVLLNRLSETRENGSVIHFHLTKREREILRLVGEGLSNSDISAKLNISFNTVSNHMKNIFKKTGTRNRVAAYRAAKLMNLLESTKRTPYPPR